MRATLRLVLLFLCSMSLWADATTYSWYSLDDKKQVTINALLFLSSTCPYCHKEEAFFKDIEANTPWLHVERHFINQDKQALVLFNQLLMQQHFDDFAVPSAFFCNTRWIGFGSAQTTGKSLLKALTYCKNQIEKEQALTPTTVDVMKHWANANMVNTSMQQEPGTMFYTSMVALLDVFNPCGLFCMMAFFGLLFLQHSKKNQMISAALFLGTVLLIHIVQPVQTNVFFELLNWLRIPAIGLGFYSLYAVYCYYKKQSMTPCVLFLWTFLLAFMVQTYQQTCVMNWALIFQQWLIQQALTNGQKIMLQISYQLIYFLPMLFFFILYMVLQRVNRFMRMSLYLEWIGLVWISVLALFLIAYPRAMAHYWLSLPIVGVGVVLGTGIGYCYKKKLGCYHEETH